MTSIFAKATPDKMDRQECLKIFKTVQKQTQNVTKHKQNGTKHKQNSAKWSKTYLLRRAQHGECKKLQKFALFSKKHFDIMMF